MTTDNLTDSELIAQANKEIAEERHMAAARLLSGVQDKSLLEENHRWTLKLGAEMEDLLEKELDDKVSPVDAGWKKQGEAHNDYDAHIHYKVDEKNNLTFRIDLALEESMLVPLCSVMNESELYSEWMPNWKHPRLGVQRSEMMSEMGRGNQIILVAVDMPYPFATREVIQHAVAIDDIDESSAILIQSKNVEPGKYINDIEIPPPEKNVVRLDFDCGMVIRFCPDDHPVLHKSKKEYPPDQKKLLLTIKQFVDAKVKYVPLKLINFFTRQVIKQLLGNFLHVAEQVQSGERAAHKEAIEAKPELYQWVQDRVNVLCSKVN